ncbi:hypothetical protein, partial [Citrobacter youngae]|uniref:hypothetical protein n=1 Tax=Citrobacter youngae TaxID=133448 RepID=UPI001953456C
RFKSSIALAMRSGWSHWVWFAVPHLAVTYVLVRRRDRFGRAAATTYAVFDLGALVYCCCSSK